MRRRVTDERGFTLVEMLVVSTLFLVVLTAVLDATASFNRLNHQNQQLNDQVDRARRGIDRGVRQLRNLARRIEAPVIARAESSDFIFQTSDPQRTWVRYCTALQADGRTWLWSLTSPGEVTSSMSGPCPGTGWERRDLVATNVTNYAAGRSFPLFSYGCVKTAPAGCPSGAADFGRIRTVGMDLLIDDNLTKRPPEARVTSGVYLRNQNEPPVLEAKSRPSGSRQVILNASASYDPEGRNLRFYWFRAPAPAFTCDVPAPAQVLWSGVTYTHTFLPTEGEPGTLRPIELVACDPGGLQARVTVQVAIP